MVPNPYIELCHAKFQVLVAHQRLAKHPDPIANGFTFDRPQEEDDEGRTKQAAIGLMISTMHWLAMNRLLDTWDPTKYGIKLGLKLTRDFFNPVIRVNFSAFDISVLEIDIKGWVYDAGVLKYLLGRYVFIVPPIGDVSKPEIYMSFRLLSVSKTHPPPRSSLPGIC